MAEFAAVITEKVTLNLAGVRELLDASKTEELLKEWNDVHPTAIKLSNKSFDLEAAQKVADYLNSRQSNIDVADISDIIAGRPEDLALQVLRMITSGLKRFELTEVNVSDNAMGKKGVDACKEILQGKKIQVCVTQCNCLSKPDNKLLLVEIIRLQ
jgi:Ran GTPase-activating protein (RanGAP) involved in mRNA processing and transport